MGGKVVSVALQPVAFHWIQVFTSPGEVNSVECDTRQSSGTACLA